MAHFPLPSVHGAVGRQLKRVGHRVHAAGNEVVATRSHLAWLALVRRGSGQDELHGRDELVIVLPVASRALPVVRPRRPCTSLRCAGRDLRRAQGRAARVVIRHHTVDGLAASGKHREHAQAMVSHIATHQSGTNSCGIGQTHTET